MHKIRSTDRGSGFTLIELLIVVGIMVAMMSLAIPAFNAIGGGTNFSSAVYDMVGTLEQARTYAMSNNTYTLVGIMEVSGTLSSSATPQTSGTGRVSMAVVASVTGLRPYDPSSKDTLGYWVNTEYNNGAVTFNALNAKNGGFLPVTKLMTFQNLHLVDLQNNGAVLPTSGNMARPSVTNDYDIPNTNCASATQFAWPLGTKLNGNPTPQYVFTKVIEFDPQGAARIIKANLAANEIPTEIPRCIEIGLQPSHGGAVAGAPANQAVNAGQIAAIQIDGMSGAIRMYRP